MDFLQVKFAVKLLEKFAEPLIKKISEISLVEWEKFKVDFDLAFSTYTENAYQKYSKIKTILYRTEPKYIYDFFQIPALKKSNASPFLANTIENVTGLSHFLLLSGSGGIGKSTLMKHFYLSALKSQKYIPIFLNCEKSTMSAAIIIWRTCSIKNFLHWAVQ